MSRKIGVHHLVLPDGTSLGKSVVELDSSGQVTRWHPLDREEPRTEWLGGTMFLSKGNEEGLYNSTFGSKEIYW